MPTETFFNLPKEKQQRIVDAAKKEFSRVSLKEASIANIIKDAEIPRGSFYQYFENKEDLYYYYFSTLKRNNHRSLLQAIEEQDGDLFAGMEDYFEKIIKDVLTGSDARFYKNLFMNMDFRSFHRVLPQMEERDKMFRSKPAKKHHQELAAVVNRELLNVKNEKELEMLVRIMLHLLFSTVTETYRMMLEMPSYDANTAIADFKTKVKWFRDGAQRKKESK